MAEDVTVRQLSNQRYNYCRDICKSVTTKGVRKINSSAFNQSIVISKIKDVTCHSESWAGTVIVENDGVFGNNFLTCMWVEVPSLHSLRQLCALCWEKAAAGSVLCQAWLWLPMQQHSTTELQCSTGTAAPPRKRASSGSNATASNPADLLSACLALVSFLPYAGHFCPYYGQLKYCHPDALNVLSLPWGVRHCELGWTASASQKGGSWQQAAVPSVFSQPLIKLWDSFYSCAVLEKLEACMDLHNGRVCPRAHRRGNC